MTTLFADYDLAKYDEEIAPEELTELGSFNHSYLQTKLAVLLFALEDYTALTELSLDVSGLDDEILRAKFKDSIKPDISVYSRRALDITEDVLKMAEMPLLAIEILSPMQAVQSLIDKVHAYFALGVRSCWIVYPYNRSVTVYTSPKTFTTYSTGDVVDETLNLRLPLAEIFS
ncbi:MAG TPA: Uma2 family endonuclease [Caldilineaceae bacterium]|nr:Uma2 family endonuclease [Caldilineaceae bacterium]